MGQREPPARPRRMWCLRDPHGGEGRWWAGGHGVSRVDGCWTQKGGAGDGGGPREELAQPARSRRGLGLGRGKMSALPAHRALWPLLGGCPAVGLVDVDRPVKTTALPMWALMWREAGSRTRAGLGLGQGLRGKKQADGKLSWRSCCGRLWAEPRRVGGLQQKGTGGAV